LTSDMTASPYFNIAQYLPETAAKYPDQAAVIFASGRGKDKKSTSMTYAALNRQCDRYAWGLRQSGISMGTTVLLMVRPSPQFIALTFALFKIGAVPILIDPGMGVKRLLDCIRNVAPDAVVGIPLTHLARILFPGSFTSVKTCIVVGASMGFLGKSLDKIAPTTGKPFDCAQTTPASPAAILFTSGSTGPAKGVLYEHGMFRAQVRLLAKVYDFQPGEVDLPGLPVFALFDAAFAMTCVIPDMDPARPAKVNPQYIVRAVKDYGVTTSFGSPAIWKRVSGYCRQEALALPSVKRILMAGAPVPGALIAQTKEILPGGDVYTPYGATESLPIASISGQDILAETFSMTRQGRGICVGRPVPDVRVRIIEIQDRAISDMASAKILAAGQIGEIIVNGPSVTREYYLEEAATRCSKIDDGDTFWHRIGDAGYLDEAGRLWFCGRKDHRVITEMETLFTVPIEAIYNCHPRVARSALVGIGKRGRQIPAIIIEPEKGFFPRTKKTTESFKQALIRLAAGHDQCRSIRHLLFHRSFPVDIRHNAKIFREKLARWAEEHLE